MNAGYPNLTFINGDLTARYATLIADARLLTFILDKSCGSKQLPVLKYEEIGRYKNVYSGFFAWAGMAVSD